MLRHAVRRYPVIAFITLTLGFQLSIVLIAAALLPPGTHLHALPKAHMVFRMRVFGPLLFAIAITAYLEGMPGIRNLFAAFLNWKVPASWYALAFSWKFIVTYVGMAAVALLGLAHWPGFVTEDFFIPLMKNMPFIVGIAIVEETSWMKFAVTRLQEKYSAFRSCLVVGLCWGCWYLPMLILGEGVPDGIPWPVFLLSMFSLTVVLGWVYNETRSGLVLLVMQIVSNCAFFIVPVLPAWWGGDPTYVVAFVIAFTVIALLVVWRAGPENLSSRVRATWSGRSPTGRTFPEKRTMLRRAA